ncbi:hypothetical protein [Deinococcus marmoris]|uniref:Transposase n=1 Tax=Deinococcus marmoris TaxID=249408 RepID=A0A1U7NXB7_9DEIO|nr:hypothetical protein [Deinococcus marmoris]OLV17562.1 hypothetical protein BOO71_0008206 [Deinococcus marmoris]
MPETINIEHELYPDAAQRSQLEQQRQMACAVWRSLAEQHARAAPGHHNEPALSRARVRTLARRAGWTRDLCSATLDDLVAVFNRVARVGPVPAELPEDQALRISARPVCDFAAELGGLETPVAAPLFLLPSAAHRAVADWRGDFFGRLDLQQNTLKQAAVAGNSTADAQLLTHLARWISLDGLARAAPVPVCPLIKLTLQESTRLRWAPGPAGPQPRLIWTFRVDDIAAPRLTGLVAADPGLRRLWTTRSRRGLTHFDNPMLGQWRPPLPAAPPGTLRRSWQPGLAKLQRQALLVGHHLRPVQAEAFQYLMAHPELAVEGLDLAGFSRTGPDYLAWLDWSGALIQHRYIIALAGLSRRLAVIPAQAGATRTCSVCQVPRAMHFEGRQGRCRACGAGNLDRDDNAAENLYRLGQAALR